MRLTPFVRMAAYNRWANTRLYDACAALPEAEHKMARPAFFGSIHATLNHILVADRTWLARLAGDPPTGLPLDTIVHDTLPDLRHARETEDRRLIAVIAALDEPALDRTIHYRTLTGVPQANTIELILQHLFNHQTHHRGQVHDMLMATPVPPPPLDLMFYAREAAAA